MRIGYEKRKYRRADRNYQRNIELGILLALGVLILIFFLSQTKVQMNALNLEDQPKFSIEMIDVPITVQERKFRKIKPQKPLIPVPAEQTEILQEVKLLPQQIRLADSFGDAGSTAMPSMARQLFEAIPREPELPITGRIVLSLKIGVDGAVVDYKIIENTTGSKDYLNSVLESMKKSQWQPARINGNKVESWVRKTYRIDTRSTE